MVLETSTYCFCIADCFPGAVPLLSLLKVMHACCSGLPNRVPRSCMSTALVYQIVSQGLRDCRQNGLPTEWTRLWSVDNVCDVLEILEDSHQARTCKHLPGHGFAVSSVGIALQVSSVTVPAPPPPLPMCQWKCSVCPSSQYIVVCGSPGMPLPLSQVVTQLVYDPSPHLFVLCGPRTKTTTV